MITTYFLKVYLPIFLLVYLLVTFLVPSWRVYKRTGVNPVTFGGSDTAHDYIGRLMKGVTGLLVTVVLLFSFSGKGYTYLFPVPYLQLESVRITGFVLVHLSLVWIIIAQQQMRNSWRIGIDAQNRTMLITGGLFSISRNPVFLAMITSVLGLFLLIPSAAMLIALVLTYILIQIQIRLEEEHLLRQHGEEYSVYKKESEELYDNHNV